MSKIFYDNIISLDKLEKQVKKISSSIEEKEEIWGLVDGLVHQRVIAGILDNLDVRYHDEFLVRLYNRPHDDGILKYLQKKITIDIEEFIKAEALNVMEEIIKDIKKHEGRKSK